MKAALMWGLALGWFVVLAFLAVDALTNPSPLLAAGRAQWLLEVLAGIGALVVGLLPVIGAASLHLLQRRRLRGRLERQKAKIERRLAKLDERDGARAAHPATSPTAPPAAHGAPAPTVTGELPRSV